jgi:hypothetical protein
MHHVHHDPYNPHRRYLRLDLGAYFVLVRHSRNNNKNNILLFFLNKVTTLLSRSNF